MQTKIIAEEGKQELFVVREFNLPVRSLFQAFTVPELLVQWMSNNHTNMVIEKLENKAHGSWRFVHTDKAGQQYCFNGVIHEYLPEVRIIRTFEIEHAGNNGNVQLEFVHFEALSETTSKLTIQTLYKSNQDRDTTIRYGMEKGANMAHDRLQELMNTKNKI